MSETPTTADPSDSRTLTAAELAMVEQWVRLADSIGMPRSYAQIYGFLFISNQPVTAQDCVEALRISRSSAGQGLKMLRDLGAIRPTFELGSRSESFTIESDLGVLIKAVMEGKLLPAFETFFKEMETLEGSLEGREHRFQISRIRKLQRWRNKLARVRRWLFV